MSGVGVSPEGEEVLIGGAGLGGVAREGAGAGQGQVRQCARIIILAKPKGTH
jgi:hypothetical protein